jgi:hypothetical protein
VTSSPRERHWEPPTAKVFEVYRMQEHDSDLILHHTDEHTLRRHIREQGTLSLLELLSQSKGNDIFVKV